MSKIQCTSRPDNNTDLYRKIEASVRVTQNGWNDISSSIEGYLGIISKANKSINLVDYLDSKFNIIYVPSNSGWVYKTFCPFHKNGNERTPSLFINKNDNRYFCQACNASGGVVNYISKIYSRPKIVIAEHILQCIGENFIEEGKFLKLNKKRKTDKFLLEISDLCRNFILQNFGDEHAVNYIMKIMKGFDLVYIYNNEKVEENIEEIIEHLKIYIEKYQT